MATISEIQSRLACDIQWMSEGGVMTWEAASNDELGQTPIHACAALGQAKSGELSFYANHRYREALMYTSATAVIIGEEDAKEFWRIKQTQLVDTILLVSKDPYFAFREAMVYLHGFRQQPQEGISDSAFIHPKSQIDKSATVMPGAHISEGAVISANVVIYPGVYIGESVHVGEQTVIYPNVCIYEKCRIGRRVIIQACAVIGEDGFGFAAYQKTDGVMSHYKIPQIGDVVIGDDVEIGACSIIDRAALETTRIGKGSKVSNLVTVGHGATLGRHTLIVAQTGIAGSTKIGDYVVMGGQCGVGGHLKIAAGAQFAARTAIDHDIPEKGKYGGVPVLPLKQMWRVISKVHKLPELFKQMKRIQARLDALESSSSSRR